MKWFFQFKHVQRSQRNYGNSWTRPTEPAQLPHRLIYQSCDYSVVDVQFSTENHHRSRGLVLFMFPPGKGDCEKSTIGIRATNPYNPLITNICSTTMACTTLNTLDFGLNWKWWEGVFGFRTQRWLIKHIEDLMNIRCPFFRFSHFFQCCVMFLIGQLTRSWLPLRRRLIKRISDYPSCGPCCWPTKHRPKPQFSLKNIIIWLIIPLEIDKMAFAIHFSSRHPQKPSLVWQPFQ